MRKNTEIPLINDDTLLTSYMVFEETVLYVVDKTHNKIGELRVNDIDGSPCLTFIHIDIEYRGKGIGSYLMQEMLKLYGHRDIYFQVRSFSESPMNLKEMKKWIARFGFKNVASYPGALVRKGDVDA